MGGRVVYTPKNMCQTSIRGNQNRHISCPKFSDQASLFNFFSGTTWTRPNQSRGQKFVLGRNTGNLNQVGLLRSRYSRDMSPSPWRFLYSDQVGRYRAPHTPAGGMGQPGRPIWLCFLFCCCFFFSFLFYGNLFRYFNELNFKFVQIWNVF
jgi:hypothetical protein